MHFFYVKLPAGSSLLRAVSAFSTKDWKLRLPRRRQAPFWDGVILYPI